MIVRVVHLFIQPTELSRFLELYSDSMDKIRQSPGCLELSLLQDVADPCHVTTLSKWTGEDALNAYRGSAFFGATWASAKSMFSDRAKAFSYDLLNTEVVSTIG